MIVKNFESKKTPNKLLQQFIKCIFSDVKHPLSEHKNYATSETIFQEILKIFEIKNRWGDMNYDKSK